MKIITACVETEGGNGGGKCCVFPFIYYGKPMYQCINNNNNGVKWCATTNNYDSDKKWGNCKRKINLGKFSLLFRIVWIGRREGAEGMSSRRYRAYMP